MSLSLIRSGEASLDLLIEELAGKLQARELVDVEAYLAEHPEHAERLRQLWPTLEALAKIGPSLSSDGAGVSPDTEPAPQTLGDFRIIREVGRGGMGIVYEAEQMSLNRRVALKVLPLAGAMDPRHLQRFKIESQAAAQLHHTNIVPVYYVGRERGVHFYAMQYIEGHSLAQVIADLRLQIADLKKDAKPHASLSEASPATAPYTPEPAPQSAICNLQTAIAATKPIAALSTIRSRTDAAYFRAVAELGIQAAEALDFAHEHGIVHRDVKPANLLVDAESRLWVTDFGLAQVQGDARMTMTGDLVGTLRYMSPEQALAKRVVVDHRTDVYSLGATLYELLTLEPAFTGTDRQELLRQIAFEEPRPPRRRHKAIPMELEIIVLKALEKNPAERYTTAKDLAEDLRRFVMDRPIQARRPTPIQRIRKWARRHRSAATAAAVCLLVTLGVTLASVGWVLGDRASRKRQAEAIVLEALDAAKPGLEEGNPWGHALLSALRQAEAQLQTGLLSSELRQRVEQLQKDVKMLAELERISLDQARVRDDHFDDSDSADEFRHAFQDYGIDIARLKLEELVGLLQRSAIRSHLVAALYDWASSLMETHRPHEAAQLQALAYELLSPQAKEIIDAELSGDIPRLERQLINAPVNELARHMITQSGRGLTSSPYVNYLRRAQARYPTDFWINHRLAKALSSNQAQGLHEEAVGFFRVCVALRPDSPGAHVNLGRELRELGRLAEAQAAFQKAVELKPDYAAAHNNLAIAFKENSLIDQAITEYRKVIELQPNEGRYRHNLANALREKGLRDEAFSEQRKCVELTPNLSPAHLALGDDYVCKGMLEEAIAAYRIAVQLNPKNPGAHQNLAVLLSRKGMQDEAINEYQKAIELAPHSADLHAGFSACLSEKGKTEEAIREARKAIELKADSVEGHYNLGNALKAKGELYEAITEYRKAIDLKPDLSEAHCNMGQTLGRQGHFVEALSAYKRGHELGSKQPSWNYPSAEWVRQAEALVELEAKLPKILKDEAQPADVAERIALAEMCGAHKKLYLAAYSFYSDAFAAQSNLADDLEHGHRYNAACCAALAGCRQGKDANQTDDKERARLRWQALDWLRADLAAYRQLLDKEPDKARPLVVERMGQWQQDTDFAGVRSTEALTKLPEAERAEWTKLWRDVAALGKQAAEGKGTQPAPVTEPELVPPPKGVPAK
jgi:serine/threonine protein kinase/Flp pilus assembly protein TadD